MTTDTSLDEMLAEVDRALHAVEPTAFFVPPRIIRRVIRHEHELPGLGLSVPHRKTYVISQRRLAILVDPDELGFDDISEFPEKAILLARPDEERLAGFTLEDLLARVWRLLFHARVHVELDRAVEAGRLTTAAIRERIDRIGQVEFDEMLAVCRQEMFLLEPSTPESAYIEAAAVYLELRYFSPHWLPDYFPALLGDFSRVDEVFAEDLDAERLFRATRPAGAPLPDVAARESDQRHEPAPLESGNGRPHIDSATERRQPPDAPSRPRTRPSRRVFARLMRKADRASTGGNQVKAAILRTRALRYADSQQVHEAMSGAAAELDRLTARLQEALEFSNEDARHWREALAGLLAGALEGFWTADKRLLYDLQKVCVDHEREISKVDLLKWLFSFGKKPIKRLLPNQREVLMSKHLRRATDHLSQARLSGEERERLSHLLHDAAAAAENQMRRRLRPLVRQALDEVALEPTNVPERVSRDKLVEELLDLVAHRGFINMGNLRDALSRNHLKLDDLSGPAELWKGDRLLRVNRRLGDLLDGVYHPAEFYLRGLQGLSSLAFGTRLGRFVTRYLAIPFGGAIVLIIGFKELAHHIVGDEHPISQMGFTSFRFQMAVLSLGLFLFGLIHVRPFRRLVFQTVKWTYRGVKGLVYDLPAWFLGHGWVRLLRRSRPYELFRRHLFQPLVLTGVFAFALPALGLYPWPSLYVTAVVFLLLAAAVNSRAGRDFEELTAERVHRAWHRIRVHVFVAMFDLVMNTFKRVLEAIERLLYAVDEWLRFKSGETIVTLAVKAVLGVFWAVIAYVVRFCVTLLIEPQVNPIKHFPVVTVAHKLILPLAITPSITQTPSPLASILLWVVPISIETANTICMAVVWCIPGVFGFLVWELKENWRLYAANRSRSLRSVLVGDHGETMTRLLRSGFHSGTLPKLFAKLRRAERKTRPGRHNPAITRLHEKLHHNVTAIRRFVERELLGYLAASRSCGELRPTVGQIHAASNSVRIELLPPQPEASDGAEASASEGQHGESTWLAFQEQSGWLVAGLSRPGWFGRLADDERQTSSVALAGFYRMATVDLIREQLEQEFGPAPPPYDITDRGLVVWPGDDYQVVVRYDLDQRPILRPRPPATARTHHLPPLDARQALFCEHEIAWRDWVAVWQAERDGQRLPALFDADVRLLPPALQRVEAAVAS
ncbi:MAG: hypothetical protein KY476_11110 [Planctomycetes bacterium]|nr:hypothetical protein [Planctomycetota bacterium]